MNINAVGRFDPTALYESFFKKVDSSGDGSIDKTEFESAVSSMAADQTTDSQSTDTMFSKLDTDGNGTISKDEMMTALKAMGEQRRANMPPPPGQNGMKPDFHKMSQDLLSNLDTSGDGSIDKSEFSAGLSALSGTNGTDSTDADAMFSKLDTNGDGSIDQSELAAGLKNMRPPMPPNQGDVATSNVSSSTGGANGSSVTDVQSRLFSDLVDSLKSSSDDTADSSTNSVDQSSKATAENRLFSDLVKSLKSSDDSENDLFSELIKSLKSSSGSSDDQISSMFNDLISNLKYSSSYSNQGSLSYSLSSSQSLLSMLA
jgi:Ca2+-binding EF-hand superfamily protein